MAGSWNDAPLSTLYDDLKTGERIADQQAAAVDKQPTLSEMVKAAWDSETTVAALVRQIGAPEFNPDAKYNPGAPEEWQRLTKDIPSQYHSLLLDAVSKGHADYKREQILAEMQRDETLSSGVGMGVRMGAAIVDPGAWALSAASGPLAAMGKTSRFSRFFAGGSAAAISNSAVEAYLARTQETRDASDVAFAALIGFGMGGGISALLKPKEVAKLRENANDAITHTELDTIRSNTDGDVRLTPQGEAELSVPKRATVKEVKPSEETLAKQKLATEETEVLGPQEHAPSTVKDEWDQFEEEALSVPKEEPVASVDNPSVIEEPPVDNPKVIDNTPAYNVGDDIFVETADGDIIGGRIKTYDPDTGRMVILDDATGTHKRVNVNEVNSAEVANNEGFIEGGFLPEGSIGSGQIAKIEMATPVEAIEATDTALTHFKIPFTNYRIPLRYDYYAKFLTSENNVIKRLGKALLADPVGEADHAGRGLNASELASLDWHMYKGRYSVVANDAFDAMAKENGWGTLERIKRRNEFNKMVTEAVRDYSTSQYVHPQVGKVVHEIQKIHKEMLEQAKKYGVKGAEEILPDPFYMMRKFNQDKLISLAKRFGEENLVKVVKGAIRSVRPITDEMAEKVAKNYVTIVRAIPYEDMHRLRMGDEGRQALRSIALKEGIDPEIMDDIMDLVLQKPGKVEGDSARLKSRTLLNENYKTTLTDLKGKQQEVSMSDFFENDATVLMDLYTRQMSGHIGLAKMGIRSDADFERLLAEAKQEGIKGFQDPNKLKKELKHMRDVYNHILGRPMSDEIYGTGERVLKAIRDLNFIRMMGQVGFAQLAEIGNTLGYAGWRAFSVHMPGVRDIIKQAKGGLIDDKLARDLVNMAGLGSEMAAMHPMARQAEDAFFDAGLTKAEAAIAHGRHAVAMVSGLAPITNTLRQMSARMFVQKFSDFARGIEKLDPKSLDKLAWAGIDKNNMKAIFSDLKKYSSITGKTSKVDGIDWEKWRTKSPDTYETFRMAVWRESRRVVQENTIGETAPWMHTQVGKILTQFRGFMMVAHAKQSLYSLHHMSPATVNAFMASTLFAGLGYVGQTSLNYAGNKEELNKRLSLESIATSAFQRNSASALIPASIDTLSGFAGWEPVFKYGRTTGLASSLVLGNPTVDFLFNKLGGTASNVLQMGTTDDHVWTHKDVKNAVNIVAPNLLGVRSFIEAWASQFPDKNPLRGYNQQ